MGWRLGVLAGGASILLGCTSATFTCAEQSDCGNDGQCEANGYCSFDDAACESGRRFGDLAAPGVAGRCVPVRDDDATSSTTSPLSGGHSTSPTTIASVTTQPDGSSTLNTATLDTGSVGTTTHGDETSDVSSTTAATSSSTTSADPPARVEEGIVLLYRFDEGADRTVLDHGPQPPIDLTIVGDDFEWTSSGLVFGGSADTFARSTSSLTKLNDACMDSGEITLEAWVTPTDASVLGPPRIMSYAGGNGVRNFSMMVGTDFEGLDEGWKVRLNTTSTNENGQPDLDWLTPVVEDVVTHATFVRGHDGQERLYLDAEVVASAERLGDFSSWTTQGEAWFFTVGNETSFERPLTGELHLAAVYCRALSVDEVEQNYAAGPLAN